MGNTAPTGASFVSRILMLWAKDVYHEPPDDAAGPSIDLPHHISASFWGPKVEKAWRCLVKKELFAEERNDISNEHAQKHNVTDPFVNKKTSTSPRNTIVRVTWRVYKRLLLQFILIFIVKQMFWIARPLVISSLVNGTLNDSTEETFVLKWLTVGLALLSFLMLWGLLDQLTSAHITVIPSCFRAGFGPLVMNKIFRLSPTSRKKYSSVELAGMATTTANEIGREFVWVFIGLNCTINLVVNFAMLFSYAGLSALPALFCVCLFIVIFFFAMRHQELLYSDRMNARDEKLSVVNEILKGIKVIKLFGWEHVYGEKVVNAVSGEMALLARIFFVNIVFFLNQIILPAVVIGVTLLCVIWREQRLDSGSLSAIVILAIDMRRLVEEVAGLSSSFTILKNAVRRVESILLDPEKEDQTVDHQADLNQASDTAGHERSLSVENAVEIRDGHFVWVKEDSDAFCLKNINVQIQKGSLIAIVGGVGAGKSALLLSLLGEVERVKGSLFVTGSVTFVPQEAWIANDTVRGNVLFENSFNQDLYDTVVEASELLDDLSLFPEGDLTKLGEKGYSLSGGQKQRICIARAAYHDSEIMLLDDPLSAVDGKVGRHIFEKIVGNEGLFRFKTRLMITNNTNLLRYFDKVLWLKKDPQSNESTLTCLSPQEACCAFHLMDTDFHVDEKIPPESDKTDTMTARNGIKDESAGSPITNGSDQLEDETDGALFPQSAFECYGLFIKAVGYFQLLAVTLLQVPPFLLFAHSNLLLTDWIASSFQPHGVNKFSHDVCSRRHLSFFTLRKDICEIDISQNDTTNVFAMTNQTFLLKYFTYNILTVSFLVIYQILFSKLSTGATKKIADSLLWSVLNSPMSFFQKTPLGQFTLRFGFDIHEIGHEVPREFEKALTGCCSVAVGVTLMLYSCPNTLLLFLPVLWLLVKIERKRASVVKHLYKLKSSAEGHLYSYVQEIIDGLHIVKAFGKQRECARSHQRALDKFNQRDYSVMAATTWLYLEIQNVVCFWVASVAIIMLINGQSVEERSNIGLIITYTLELGEHIVWLLFAIGHLRVNAIYLGRLASFIASPNEASWSRPDVNLPSEWPQKGEIAINKFYLRYEGQETDVLKNICMRIKGGEKIGIVGRTGAGKSSLAMSLLRLVEARSGKIIIDDVDISTIGLHDLRSRIAVIPQDPILFTGDLRANIDPGNSLTDEEIWDALRHVEMYAAVEALPGGLHAKINEGGSNFSVGQKQLLCFARAILKRSKILVLDEATASMDLATDHCIQQIIRSEFSHCTVLTIAHRLSTVLDYNRILVMSEGEIVGFDTVSNLKSTCQLFQEMLDNRL